MFIDNFIYLNIGGHFINYMTRELTWNGRCFT